MVLTILIQWMKLTMYSEGSKSLGRTIKDDKPDSHARRARIRKEKWILTNTKLINRAQFFIGITL
jgi:hypothetical protein